MTEGRWFSRWVQVVALSAIAGLVVFRLVLSSGARCQVLVASGQGRPQQSFLEKFQAQKPAAVVTREVTFPSAVGPVAGYVARPQTSERLPAVLLLPGEQGLNDWMKGNTRDLAGNGYVVLAVAPPARVRTASAALADEKTLAQLSSAVRWLRRRPDVQPEQLGVLGWSSGGDQAVALAATTPLQGCVACDTIVTDEPGLVAGLRGTPVLVIVAGRDQNARKSIPAFRKAAAGSLNPLLVRVYDGVEAGFMGPEDRKGYNRAPADKAWFEVYEFLGKYVEDAPLGPAIPQAAQPPPAEPSVATIADIMRAVNESTGVRGTLLEALRQEPANQRAWDRVRANASLMAEATTLLGRHAPRRGTHAGWLKQVSMFSAATTSIVAAADRHDYPAARNGLMEVAARCPVCHEQHR
ncbi:MAG: dienelactone hydrolase family protein [Planctomycetes bacterium]|nr:dienelactone hydrolase family protein [Planctomycetota bacterium]